MKPEEQLAEENWQKLCEIMPSLTESNSLNVERQKYFIKGNELAIRSRDAEWEKEGRLNLIREMMNTNKTPFWIKVLPENIDTTPEHMFSFAEEYSKMKVEKAKSEWIKEQKQLVDRFTEIRDDIIALAKPQDKEWLGVVFDQKRKELNINAKT